MTSPSHDKISQAAWQLWQNRGCPTGCDTEIWLDAEQNLITNPTDASTTPKSGAPPGRENHLSPAQMEQNAILLDGQKAEARAPQSPQHSSPTVKPPQSGKPLWPQPQSS